MIQFNLLEIRRVIMHRIIEKSLQDSIQRHVEVTKSDQLVNIDESICSLIKKRLMESCGRQGKSFLLNIENEEDGSCFDLIKDIHDMEDRDFIQNSKEIVELLVSAQDAKGAIPGGYFLLVEASIRTSGDQMPVYIIMKAENQEALNAVGNSIQALEHIFLSPAQKMYKVGIFEQISNAIPLTKSNFQAYLFDSQFNNGTSLAEYFYKDFLGLTIEGNKQVQTKMFYDKFNNAIDVVFKNDNEQRTHCKDLLRAEMTNHNENINPHDAITNIIPSDKRNVFIARVGNKFPNSFVKDTMLIQKKIDKRVVFLRDSVRLYAPEQLFTDEAITITTDPDDQSIKIIKIRVDARDSENAE